MKKYNVYGLISASKFIGVFDADTEGEAIEKASDSDNYHVSSLCCHCANEIEIGDIYDFDVEEIEVPE